MSEPVRLPDFVTGPQNRASNPDTSVWVSANAGSGKTHVLMLRVIKLLLRGTDPAKILCITFTKAAAANMATRVFAELAKWTSYDDAQLDEAIRSIGEETGPAQRARARQLFATALETPGGLKVQTIHAFCTKLLHQFPFEADVAAGFTVLDETAEQKMLDDLTLRVMLDAAAKPDHALTRALDTVLATAADQTFRDVIGDAIGKRDEIESWIGNAGSIEAAIADLSRTLGIDPSDTMESLHAEFWAKSLFSEKDWPTLAGIFESGSKTDAKHAERLKRAATLRDPARFDAYLEIFCNKKDFEPRKSIITKAISENDPELLDRLVREQQRACELLVKRRAVECRDRTATLVTIAHAVVSLYGTEKNRRGLLDYDDLIDKTLDLFKKTSAAWVLYKLDAGIDHVLIDEAQDTSPKQWSIIGTIIGEFTAGAGARAVKRTLFTVGDDKQSIFSFQGARPDIFDRKFREYSASFKAAALPLEQVKLQTSFRSGEIVLSAVDHVFSRREIYASLTADTIGIPSHKWLDDAAPGYVEIWETTAPKDRKERLAWDAPFDAEPESSPRAELARRIARNVRRWIDQETIGKGRPVTARDILVLVRQRGPLFEAIIRALKDQNVAVAGADRLVLTEHIAVMDLMALADAVLLPHDELALACVLKSPLFGLSEDDLYEIAWNRGTLSLRESLFRNSRYAAASDRIEKLTAAARSESPFTFYANVLGPGGGRKRIFARLGHEAADAIDEFLNLALVFESRETPSLQGFIAWLRASKVEVKRDMEIARDEVRVMTVHGAKGLEAPIVVLADTTTPPAGPTGRPPRLLFLPPARAVPGAPEQMVWAGSKDDDVGPMRAARDDTRRRAEDEYRRLLYVAMTRAAERLIVCGADGANDRPEGCWYNLVREGLKERLVEVPAIDGDGVVWRYQKHEETRASRQPASVVAASTPPDWLHRPVPAEQPRATIVTPSSEKEFIAAAASAFARPKALRRGSLIHRLMQSLPEIAEKDRENAARRFLARAGTDFSEEETRDIGAQALALLADPRFSALFAAGSRAEVPLVGSLATRLGPPLLVSGQIDRLVVTPDMVYIADYKTNRPAPRSLDDLLAIHGGYVRQLALYRAVLSKIYPDRPVRAALLWTDAPELMEIPASFMDREIAALTAA